MPISKYLKDLRQRVGHDLLLLPAVAAVVINETEHVLFQRRADDGTWSLPAGSIEPNETPAEAITREVLEETGLTVSVERVIGVFGGEKFTWTYPNGDTVQYTAIVFLCRILSGQLEAQDGESAELRFFPPDSTPELQMPYPRDIFLLKADKTLFN